MVANPTDKFTTMRGRPPEEAKFFWNGGPVELADRTWFSSMLSGATAFETDDGLVLVDSGTAALAPHIAKEIRTRTTAPVHTAIFTHGHADHAYGLSAFLTPDQSPPRVIAHSAMPARFERYRRTAAHNAAVNARQFGGAADADTGVDWGEPAIPPDTYYDDQLDISVGGIDFELQHARGETDDHTWVFCPDRSVVCPGDLIIWGVPNAGNPQKVQRYPWDWATALRAMSAKSPRSMGPGHGGPIVNDPDTIQAILTETADLLETIVERTVAMLNDGSPPHVDIVREIDLPSSDSPWLQPVYDEAEFVVRNVIRYFGGWFTGRPSDLKPAARSDLAKTIVELAGGTGALIDRAAALATAGDLPLACHLADLALEADPSDTSIGEAVATIYEARAGTETGLMAINIFNSAAAYARAGRAYR